LVEGDKWGVLKAGCVNGGQFHPEEHKVLPITLEPRSELEVHHGDVLMSRASGSPQLIGSVSCLEHPPARLMLSDKIFRLRLASDIGPRFFARAMGSIPLRAQIEQAIGGAEGLANNLSQARIKGFWLAIPPAHEQREIECYIEEELGRFDELEQQTQSSINLLRERRATLISATVTGKIDVRQMGEA
jgi:type I restriction enzyme S subunit